MIPPEQVHPELFKGAGKRFKAVAWNKLETRRLAQPKSGERWERVVKREGERRAEKAKKLKE